MRCIHPHFNVACFSAPAGRQTTQRDRDGGAGSPSQTRGKNRSSLETFVDMDALRTSTVTGQNPMHGGLKATMSFHAGRSTAIAQDATPRRSSVVGVAPGDELALAVARRRQTGRTELL